MKKTGSASISVAVLSSFALTGIYAPTSHADENSNDNTVRYSSLEDGHLSEEEVQTPLTVQDSSGRVNFTSFVKYDGTGHGTDQQTLINSDRGYELGDDSPLDGIVTPRDFVGYDLSYNVAPSSTDTNVSFTFQLGLFDTPDEETRENIWHGTHNTVRIRNFERFCEGGTGYAHTGTVTWGANRSDGRVTCAMNFPASDESVSVSGTTIEGYVGEPRTHPSDNSTRFSARDAYLTPRLITGNYDNPSTNSGYASHLTRIVGVHGSEAVIAQAGGSSVAFHEGEEYMSIPMQVIPAMENMPNDVNNRKGVISYGGEAFIPVKSSGRVVIEDLPEGAVILATLGGQPSDAITVDNENGVVTFDEAESIAGNRINPDNWGGNNFRSGQMMINVLIPFDIVGNNNRYPLRAHIEDWRVELQDGVVQENLDNVLYPGQRLGLSDELPGIGEDADFNTGAPGLTVAQRAMEGVSNNKHYRTNNLVRRNSGQFIKDMVGTDRIGVISTDNSAHRRTVGDDYFTRFRLLNSDVLHEDLVWCDIWESGKQQIRTDAEVEVQTRDRSGGSFQDVDAEVRYGITDEAYDPEASVPNGSADNIGSRNCAGEGVTWQDAPTAETNIVTISLDDAVDIRNRGAGSGEHRAFIPMTTAPMANYPVVQDNPDAVENIRNNLYTSTSERNFTRTDNSFINVTGFREDLVTSAERRSGNAGTVVNLGNSLKFGVHEKIDGSEPPRVTYEFDSAYADLQLSDRFYEFFDDVEIERPDWGDDELPGTDDDVSGWTVTATLSDDLWDILPERYRNGSLFDDERMMNEAFGGYSAGAHLNPMIRGLIPGYIEDGTILQNAIELDNDRDERSTSNNRSTSEFTVNSNAAVTQSSWTETPSVWASEELSWVVAWGNRDDAEQGRYRAITRIPHIGDGLGSNINLENITIDRMSSGDDVQVYVTSDDPAGVNYDDTNWVLYEDRDSLDGEITAVMVDDPVMESDRISSIRINADVLKDDLYSHVGPGYVDRAVLRTSAADVETLSNRIPETSRAEAQVKVGRIAHNTFWDENQDGEQSGETEVDIWDGVRYDVYDEDGNLLPHGEDSDGATRVYSPGEYRVVFNPTEHMTMPPNRVITDYELTTPREVTFQITDNNRQKRSEFGIYNEEVYEMEGVPDHSTTPFRTSTELDIFENDELHGGEIEEYWVSYVDDSSDDPGEWDYRDLYEDSPLQFEEGTYRLTDMGIITFEPAPNWSGNAPSLEYGFGDNRNLWIYDVPVTVTVEDPEIEGPTAEDDRMTAIAGSDAPLSINPLANDNASGFALDEERSTENSRWWNDNEIVSWEFATDELTVDGEGTWSQDEEGNAVFTPENDEVYGDFSIPYVITDANGNTAQAQITATIYPAMTPLEPALIHPAAAEDTITVEYAETAVLNPLENDEARGLTQDEDGEWVDNALTEWEFTGETDAPEGQWSRDDDGNAVFTPADGFSGIAEIEYEITDENGNTASSVIRVTVEPEPEPEPEELPDSEDDAYETPFNTPIEFDPRENDDEVYADGYIILLNEEGAIRDRVTVDGGEYIVTDDGVQFIPEEGFRGEAGSVDYRVFIDGYASQSTITVTVGDPEPSTSIDDQGEVTQGESIVIDVLENDTLSDDAFSWESVELLDENGEPTSELRVEGGVVTLNDDNTLTFTADDDFEGTSGTFSYRATDNNGESTVSQVVVNVTAPEEEEEPPADEEEETTPPEDEEEEATPPEDEEEEATPPEDEEEEATPPEDEEEEATPPEDEEEEATPPEDEEEEATPPEDEEEEATPPEDEEEEATPPEDEEEEATPPEDEEEEATPPEDEETAAPEEDDDAVVEEEEATSPADEDEAPADEDTTSPDVDAPADDEADVPSDEAAPAEKAPKVAINTGQPAETSLSSLWMMLSGLLAGLGSILGVKGVRRKKD